MISTLRDHWNDPNSAWPKMPFFGRKLPLKWYFFPNVSHNVINSHPRKPTLWQKDPKMWDPNIRDLFRDPYIWVRAQMRYRTQTQESWPTLSYYQKSSSYIRCHGHHVFMLHASRSVDLKQLFELDTMVRSATHPEIRLLNSIICH